MIYVAFSNINARDSNMYAAILTKWTETRFRRFMDGKKERRSLQSSLKRILIIIEISVMRMVLNGEADWMM